MVVFNGEIIEYKRNINNDNEFLNEKHLDGFLISIVTHRLSFMISSAFILGTLAIANLLLNSFRYKNSPLPGITVKTASDKKPGVM